MYDLVTLGEAMIRFSPPDFKRLEQTTTLDLNIGGAELNVAVGVARLGLKSAWVSKLPDNPLGRMIANKGRELGVDVSTVLWEKEGRTGLYFLEFGAAPRTSAIVYDRANSSFSNIRPGEVNWDAILNSSRCLHLTGITPALSKSAAATALEALQKAKTAGCKVSMDLNYRSKLWSPEEAHRTLEPMMQYVDILITTQGDTRTILGLEARDDETLAGILLDKYPFEMVAVSYRQGEAVWRCLFSALAATREESYTTRSYEIEIVDQLGRGDSFAAGFLYGVLGPGDLQAALDYGVAFAALAHSFPGDFNWCTREEVEALLQGGAPRGVAR